MHLALGVPVMTQDTQIAIRISTQALAALDQLRKNEDDLPSRAEMIRRLIERAAEGRKRK
jgi:metal-responsive CopG/Arc/MetJ family transcriptional regulator